MGKVFPFDVALLKASVTVHLVEEKSRRITGVLAAGRPHDGAQAKVSLVQKQDVQEVTDFGAAYERQNLVDGQIRGVQAITEVIIRLHGEKTEGRVVRPVEPG